MKNTATTTYPLLIAASILTLVSFSALAQAKPDECTEIVGTVNTTFCVPGFCGEMTTNVGMARCRVFYKEENLRTLYRACIGCVRICSHGESLCTLPSK